MSRRILPFWRALLLAGGAAFPRSNQADPATAEFSGWSTNGPAVYRNSRLPVTNLTLRTGSYITNQTFVHFLPGSLNDFVWTNLLARTNGRSPHLWSVNAHPPGWPAQPPSVAWNTNSLVWGMKGMTALSPCWMGEGAHGQVPVTALTRRHGYTRGHGMAPDGLCNTWKGQKVWFVTKENRLVAATIARTMVRISQADYTIFLFRDNLPASIEPLRVAAFTNVTARFPDCPGAPWPVFQKEQTGQINAGIPGFTMNARKGGDSGSPNLLALANELIFFGGRGTAGPLPQMQADMDALCRLEKLDPSKHQLQWADLSRFPNYPKR